MKCVDVGCGNNKKSGFIGLDVYSYPDVDIVWDVRAGLPFKENEVDKFYCSHFLEHLTGEEVIDCMCQFYQCLKPGGTLEIIVPGVHDYGWYCDLGHKSFWGIESFKYFTGYSIGNFAYYKTFFKEAFKLLKLDIEGIAIHAILEKP